MYALEEDETTFLCFFSILIDDIISCQQTAAKKEHLTHNVAIKIALRSLAIENKEFQGTASVVIKLFIFLHPY